MILMEPESFLRNRSYPIYFFILCTVYPEQFFICRLYRSAKGSSMSAKNMLIAGEKINLL